MAAGRSNRRCRAALRGAGWVCVLLVSALAAPPMAEACAVCYGAADSAMTEGMNNGILVLLGIVAVVQVGFVALFVSIRQRARRLRRQKGRYQLIQGGAG